MVDKKVGYSLEYKMEGYSLAHKLVDYRPVDCSLAYKLVDYRLADKMGPGCNFDNYPCTSCTLIDSLELDKMVDKMADKPHKMVPDCTRAHSLGPGYSLVHKLVGCS
jgi:hypothetical protein